METQPSSQLQKFNPNCPYFQEAPTAIDYSSLPMCRLIETFKDGTTFIADSFGDRDWIDITKARPCGRDCPCNELGVVAGERLFAFVVKKTPTDMEIVFRDPCLQAIVTGALTNIERELPSGETPWNGFLLLKHRSLLATKLLHMQQYRPTDPQDNFRVAILSLLVNGVLEDPQVFKSYGFLCLYNQGCLGLDDWEWFYTSNLRRKSAKCVHPGMLSMNPTECLDDTTTSVFATLTDMPTGCDSDDYQPVPYPGDLEPLPPLQEYNGKGDENMTLSSSDYSFSDAFFRTPSRWDADHSYRPYIDFITYISDIDALLFLWPEPKSSRVLSYQESVLERNAALYNAIQSQNIVEVQNILQHYESPTGDVKDLRGDHQPTRAQDNTHMDTEILLLAVRMNYTRCTKLLLNHGYDVNCQLWGETPLSAAAIHGSDSLVRLLLQHGAEVEVATLILQSKSHYDPRPASRINSLARSYTSHVAQKKLKCNQNLIRLRNNFWKEHELMRTAAKDARQVVLPSYPQNVRLDDDSFDFESDYANLVSFRIEQDTRSAWATGVRTIRDLCNGNIPSNAHDVLIFLALAKSMAPIIDECGAQGMEAEFFADIPRWQLIFASDEQEHRQFATAVTAIWNIDVTQSRMDRFEDTFHFEMEILHIQDLTYRLLVQARSAFQLTEFNELDIQNVQALWRARQATSTPHYLEEPVNYQTEEDTPFSVTNDDIFLPELDGTNTLRLPKLRNRMSETSSRIESPFTPNAVLVILLAGTIFAIILAFLLLLRSSASYSTIKGLFSPCKPICDQTHTIRRTRALLELYLGGSTMMIHRRNDQQNPGSTGSTDYGEMHRSSSSGSTFLESDLAPGSGRTSPPSVHVKKTFCDRCVRDFGTSSNLGKHNKDMHEKVRYACRFSGCGKTYQRNDRRVYHESTKHKENYPGPSKRSGTLW